MITISKETFEPAKAYYNGKVYCLFRPLFWNDHRGCDDIAVNIKYKDPIPPEDQAVIDATVNEYKKHLEDTLLGPCKKAIERLVHYSEEVEFEEWKPQRDSNPF